MRLGKILILLVFILISCKSAKLETQTEKNKTELNQTEFPKQIGFVNDFEKIFTNEQTETLNKLLDYYKKTSNRDIAVITLESIPEGRDFFQYAVELSDNWKIGKGNNGNGLTIVFSKALRTVRISTTDKTRQLYLSDDFCQKVIDQNMIPEFKKGNYYDGILLGLNELIRKWI